MAAPDWELVREHLSALQAAALEAAAPGPAVCRSLSCADGVLTAGPHAQRLADGARIFLVAFGKAAAGMARGALGVLGDRIERGLIVHPHGLDPSVNWPRTFRVIGAAHPVPDAGSLAAGAAVAGMLADTRAGDVVLVLISGGGSALLESPQPGISLEELQGITRALQRSGADIVELNTVRRALSTLKGGGLARLAAPARVIALMLSDVMGDRPEAIASGPTTPSPTGPADALRILEARGLGADYRNACETLRRIPAPSGPPPDAWHVIAGSNRLAAEAAGAAAERLGFRSLMMTQYLQGEAREAGRVIGGIARTVREAGRPAPPPLCMVFGGETTVTVRGEGRGGRNHEVALGAALALDGAERVALLAFGTDGVDGASDAAGARITGDTLRRAAAQGLSAEAVLAANDTDPFFRALGDQVRTGPTGTNVNDLAIALIYV
jgi:hydroxypyruvate reductase